MSRLDTCEPGSAPKVQEITPEEAVCNHRLLELFSGIAELTKELEERDCAAVASLNSDKHLTFEKANDSKDGPTALVLVSITALLVFFLDLFLPLGFAVATAYVAPILLSLWSRRSHATSFVAATCTALTVAGYYLSSASGEHWNILANRAVALFVIWASAILCMFLKRRWIREIAVLDRLRRSEVEAAKMEKLLEDVHHEIYMFDADTLLFLQVNRGARKNLGYSMAELRKLTPLELNPELSKESFSRRIAPLKDGSQDLITFITYYQRKDGSRYPVEVHLQLLECKSAPAFVAIVLDITERKRYEDGLRDARKAAEAANRAKSEFLANMSHEIRTPMTAILGFADILCDNILRDKNSDPENVTDSGNIDAVNTIKRNGEYLLDLINDVLDLSKIEADKLDVEHIACSPRRIVTEVASLMAVRAEQKGLSLDVWFDGPIPETIQSDPTRIRQILINVVGNAIKFTDAGAVQITTRLLNYPGSMSRMQFEVSDQGIGIPADKIDMLFQPFTQADRSTTRRFGGTGLGLTISRHLAIMLGGDIDVQSTPGQGSTFTFTVETGPLDDVKLLAHPNESLVWDEASSQHNPAKHIELNGRVLLAEDSPDNQRLIELILTHAGAEVTVAENGQIAVEKALAAQESERPFDLILMDIQMPVMDGYAATRKLRDAQYAGKIVALTAHAMVDARNKCLEAGCDDYMAKPFDRNQLIELVDRCTIRRRQESF